MLNIWHERDGVKISWLVCLLCPWATLFMGFPLSGYTGSNRWQLDWKTEKVALLSSG